MGSRSVVSSLAVAAALLTASSAFAAESRDYGASGRVSALEGTLYGRGPYDTETSELAQNAVLRTGDEIFTDEGTFAEIELPNGTFLRLAGNTTVVVNKLDPDGVEIALTEGAAYLSRGINAPPARFQTFAGTVDLGGRSMARVANDQKKSALEVSVAEGSAELRGDRTQQQIRERETLNTGNGANRVEGFNPANGDAFDRWNGEREAKVRGYNQDSHVAANTVGSYELEGNGTWVQVDGYWAWRPTVVSAGWRPYSEGYWAWEEPWGWVWVDYQPWGYTTCHYGRWYYRNAYGWVWYPDPIWAPAWVVWAAFDASIGWAPCDFWGRPIYCHSYYSYYDYDAWCYTDSGYFYQGGGYHYTTVVSARHENVPGSSHGHGTTFSRGAIGHEGRFAIRKFDAESMKRATPVPVRDPVRELTPAHIVKAAAEGRLQGVSAENRRGDLLSRAATQGGVKPEPWNRGRNDLGSGRPGERNNLGGSRDLNENVRNPKAGATPGDRLKTEGWSGRGNEDGRASEGWNPRGAERGTTIDRGGNDGARYPGSFDRGNTAREPASHFQPQGGDLRGNDADRGGAGDQGSGYKGANRYEPRGNSGSSEPRGNYEPRGNSGSAEPRGNYEPRGNSGSSEPRGNYEPRGNSGSSEPRGNYEPRGNSGSSAPSRPSNPAPSAPSRPSGNSGTSTPRSAPAPAPAPHSSPSRGGKHSSWSAPSSGKSVAFGGGSSHSSGFSFGHSSGHSSGGGVKLGKGLKFGKH